MEQAYRNYTLHINLEVLPNQPTGYTPPTSSRSTAPATARTASGCPTRPTARRTRRPQPPISAVDDGVKGGARQVPAAQRPRLRQSTSGYAGTASERSLVNAFAAPVMGVPDDDVPDLASLLFAPLARGSGGERPMKLLDKKTTGDAVRLLIFIVVTTIATELPGRHDRQHLVRGQQALQGGLQRRHRRGQGRRRPGRRRQGRQRAGRRDRSTAPGRWSPSRSTPSASSSPRAPIATIRYRNLVGQRYIALTQGVGGARRPQGGPDHPAGAHPARPST